MATLKLREPPINGVDNSTVDSVAVCPAHSYTGTANSFQGVFQDDEQPNITPDDHLKAA